MARTKPPDERKADLVAAAIKVFSEKGYRSATVSEIVQEAGVAQGTFYLYFDGKEEILDTVAQHMLTDIIGTAAEIAQDPGLCAVEKVQTLTLKWLQLGSTPGPLIEELHDSRYAELHDRMAQKALYLLMPALVAIIEQGVAEGSMDVLYPQASALIWASVNFPTGEAEADTGLTLPQMVEAYGDFLRRLLGLRDPDVFAELTRKSRRRRRTGPR